MAQNGTLKRSRPSRKELENQLQTLSVLTARLKLSGRLGESHGGDRDLYETLGYPRKVSSQDFIARWKRQDIARAIVDRPVKKTWQGPVFVTESTEENETLLEKEYKELNDRLGLKTKFMRVDRLAQLGRYAVMLLGFDDSSQDTWSRPVTEGKRELRYIRVVSEKNTEIQTYENDESNERFGLPRLYKIHLQQPGTTNKSKSLLVHYSRLLHITPDLLEDDIEGHPIMETAYNRLMDIEKLIGGSAEMFWRGARPGYAGKADPDYKMGTDVEKALKEQIDEYEHNLRRFLVTEGVDLQALAQQIADPKGHLQVQMQMVSALTGIPLRILMGSERGELASSQDDQNWKEWVQTRRQEQAEPGIVRPFVDKMIRHEVLPPALDESQGYAVSWSDLFVMGEKEKAEVGKERSQALANYHKEPMAQQDIPLQAFLQFFLRMDEQEVEQIIELRDQQMEEMISREDLLEDPTPDETETVEIDVET